MLLFAMTYNTMHGPKFGKIFYCKNENEKNEIKQKKKEKYFNRDCDDKKEKGGKVTRRGDRGPLNQKPPICWAENLREASLCMVAQWSDDEVLPPSTGDYGQGGWRAAFPSLLWRVGQARKGAALP